MLTILNIARCCEISQNAQCRFGSNFRNEKANSGKFRKKKWSRLKSSEFLSEKFFIMDRFFEIFNQMFSFIFEPK